MIISVRHHRSLWDTISRCPPVCLSNEKRVYYRHWVTGSQSSQSSQAKKGNEKRTNAGGQIAHEELHRFSCNFFFSFSSLFFFLMFYSIACCVVSHTSKPMSHVHHITSYTRTSHTFTYTVRQECLPQRWIYLWFETEIWLQPGRHIYTQNSFAMFSVVLTPRQTQTQNAHKTM